MIHVPVLNIIAGFLFISVRLSGLFLFAPFLGSASIPPRVKAGLVVAISALLYPLVSPHFPVFSLGSWPVVVLGELTMGMATGIVTSLVFDAVGMAGQILSVQMGYSLVTLIDPTTQADSTVMATFHQTIALLIFLELGVHFWLLKALSDSFFFLPPGSAHLSGAFMQMLLSAAGAIFTVGLQLAAPVLAATMLADMVLGLLGKASPQLPVMLLGPAVKAVMGILILAAAMRYWPKMFGIFFTQSTLLAERLLALGR